MNATSYWVQLAPEWILLIGACAVLFLGVTRIGQHDSSCQFLSLTTVLGALTAALWLNKPDSSFAAMGLWITSLSHYTRCVGLGMGVLILLVNWYTPPRDRAESQAMILFSLLGLLLTASANDFVVLFMAIELVSIPTYVLIGLSRDDSRAAESTVKYFFLGALAAAILAYGLSFLYGAAGTTTLFHVVSGQGSSTLSKGEPLSGIALIGILLVVGGLAFKIGAVPFHVYIPDVYEGAASPVTGLLGFVPKLAGFIALIKILSASQGIQLESISWLLWVLAAATMTAGNVLALLQKNVKRMLAYSSIAHTGYLLIALLVGPGSANEPMQDGIAALLFYIAIYGVMNLGVFALLTAFRTEHGDVEMLEDLYGLAIRSPWSALGLAVCVFSLMGFPPMAGFLGKLYIFGSAFSVPADHAFRGPLLALALIGVVNSAIGAAYYLRIVAAAYSGRDETVSIQPTSGYPVRAGLALCAIPLLVLFAAPSRLTVPSQAASADLRQSLSPRSVKFTASPLPVSSRVTPAGAGVGP